MRLVAPILLSIICAAPLAAQEWTGTYAGIGAGLLVGGQSASPGDEYRYQGMTLSGFAGARSTQGPLVFGIEANVSTFLPMSRSLNGGSAPTEVARHSQISGRTTVGLEFGRALPYLGAGVVIANQAFALEQSSSTTSGSSVGALLAVGVDLDITEHAFFRAEATYSIFAENGGDYGLPYLYNKNQPAIMTAVGWKF